MAIHIPDDPNKDLTKPGNSSYDSVINSFNYEYPAYGIPANTDPDTYATEATRTSLNVAVDFFYSNDLASVSDLDGIFGVLESTDDLTPEIASDFSKLSEFVTKHFAPVANVHIIDSSQRKPIPGDDNDNNREMRALTEIGMLVAGETSENLSPSNRPGIGLLWNLHTLQESRFQIDDPYLITVNSYKVSNNAPGGGYFRVSDPLAEHKGFPLKTTYVWGFVNHPVRAIVLTPLTTDTIE